MTFIDQVLPSGLRVVIEPMDAVASAAAGFLVRTGARDEVPEQAGVSHFLEHMCFKGTPKRSWHDITIGFDDLGSTYNAFTSKERTFYFGWVRRGDLAAQIELLADMMRSTLPPDEFATEKNVILEEIAMSRDQIEHHVYDLIHERAFDGHPLGWPVLGDEKTVARLTRDEMHAYFSQRYHPANMVLVVAGNVDPREVLDFAERLCDGWPASAPRPQRGLPGRFAPGTAMLHLERFKQHSVCWCYPGPALIDERDSEAADALAAILGGSNSRFFWNIVQQWIAPVASAWRVDYSDCGLMVLFGFCEPEHAPALSVALQREAERVTREGVTDEELGRVKNRRRTSLVVEAESPYHRLTQLADDVDVFGRPRTVAERMEAVESLTRERLAEYLERWPITRDGLMVSVGPRRWPEA